MTTPVNKILCLWLFSLLFMNSRAHEETHCNHGNIKQNPGFLEIEEDMSSLDNGRVLAAASYPNIRIYPFYDFLFNSAPASYAAYISNDLVPPVVDYFQSALKVKYPVSGNLVVGPNVSMICEETTPPILQFGGVPADFFIYFDSEEINGTEIANTEFCFLTSGTNRPIIARTIININMMPVALGDVLVHEKNMYTIMHEMMHAFGFSSSLYPYFIDASAKTLTGHIKSITLEDGSNHAVIDVSPLTEKLRAYYGCSTLEGAIMEDGGGSGTDDSHFERKFFVYEAMASGSILGRRISQFSLSMLQGSGWYVIDYSYAEPFFYGQGQGCSFITSNCSSTSTNFDEFCVGSKRGCSPTGRGGGTCTTDSLMNGCKYYFPQEDSDCENEVGADYTRLPDLQVYGRATGSKCFTGTLNTRASPSLTSFCFKYTCSGNGTSTQLSVQIEGNTVTCDAEGTKTIDGYYGAINCPDPLTFCNTAGNKYCPRNCMGRGTCVNGQCQCNSGYSGIDCALNF